MQVIIPIAFVGFCILIGSLLKTDTSRKLQVKAPELPEANKLEPNQEDLNEAVQEELTASGKYFPSPIAGVSDTNWTKFTRWSKQGDKNTITAGYDLGYFLIDMQTLEFLGYAKNVTKKDYNGRQVWQGDWIEPYSEAIFLSNAKLQYEVYVKLCKWLIGTIKERYSSYIGKTLEENDSTKNIVSLSGLLGVAILAGIGGLGKWLEGDKKQATTDTFKASNGIF